MAERNSLRHSARLDRFSENPFTEPKTKTLPVPLRLIKAVIGYGVLLPLRMIMLIVVLVLTIILFNVICFGYHGVLPPGRQKLMSAVVKINSRLILFALGYVWIEKVGKVARSRDAPIVIANHSSFIDGFLLAHYHAPSFVAKSDVKKIPIIGTLTKGLKCIFVDRNSPDSRKETLDGIHQRVEDCLNGSNSPPLAIFPEGTTTNGTCIISFKTGAFVSGATIQPVCLRYPYKYCSPAYYIGGSPGKSLIMLMAQFYNRAEVRILEPYVPNDEEREDSFLYASNLRSEMAAEMGYPLTDHTYEDVLLQMDAFENHEPIDAFNIEFGGLKRLYQLDLKSTKDILRRFTKNDLDKNGSIDVDEFAGLLGLPLTERVHDLFELFDTNGNGQISFKEFVLGLNILNQSAEDVPTEEIIEKSFNLFDLNNDGIISADEFTLVITSTFPGISDSEINTFFEDMDTNKTGGISYEQFLEFALQHPEYVHMANYTKK